MSSLSLRPCGDFRTSYKADTTIFPTPMSRNFCIGAVVLALFAPLVFDSYYLNLAITIFIFGIASLGLNLLVGFTGQISLGHAAFFGFGAFSSAWLNNTFSIPVVLAIPLAGVMTTAGRHDRRHPGPRASRASISPSRPWRRSSSFRTSSRAPTPSQAVRRARWPTASTCSAGKPMTKRASSMWRCSSRW